MRAHMSHTCPRQGNGLLLRSARRGAPLPIYTILPPIAWASPRLPFPFQHVQPRPRALS